MIDENRNQIYLDISIMACPKCGQIDDGTLRINENTERSLEEC